MIKFAWKLSSPSSMYEYQVWIKRWCRTSHMYLKPKKNKLCHSQLKNNLHYCPYWFHYSQNAKVWQHTTDLAPAMKIQILLCLYIDLCHEVCNWVVSGSLFFHYKYETGLLFESITFWGQTIFKNSVTWDLT